MCGIGHERKQFLTHGLFSEAYRVKLFQIVRYIDRHSKAGRVLAHGAPARVAADATRDAATRSGTDEALPAHASFALTSRT